MIRDSKLSYENHLQSVFSSVNKTIALLRKLQPTPPRKSLLTIDKSFDQVSNELCSQSVQSLQYSAAIVMTGAIRGTSSEKLSHKPGLEMKKSRRWLGKLCLFYKLIKKDHLLIFFN